jgi:fluoride exporter
MLNLFLVGLGGSIGAMARFGLSQALGATTFPYATLTANVVGGLLMGVLASFMLNRHDLESVRLFFGVGILGGFTTFSAFSLETLQMVERKAFGMALGYIFASVGLSLAALAAAYLLTRRFL